MSDDEGGPMAGPGGPLAPAPLPLGVRKEVIKEADSKSWATPKPGDEVTIDYAGSLEADGSEFDSSHSRDAPFVITLGKGEVTRGLDLGIATMHKGEVAKFTLQPEFGFGDAGSTAPLIPPSAVVVFVVELISWITKDDLFGDGHVIKSLLTEGDGFDHPKRGGEVRITMKAVQQDGTLLREMVDEDYAIGSNDLEQLGKVVDKALISMKLGEACSLLCSSGCEQLGLSQEVTIKLELTTIYNIADVSFLKDKSVMKRQVKEGDGYDKPQHGYRATVRVEAVVDGGSSQALPEFTGPKDLRFVCGNGEVCDVVEFAAVEMKKGERAVVTCTAHEKAREPALGLGSLSCTRTLFTLELLDFDAGASQWKMSTDDKLEQAADWKDMGAKLFKAGRFELALNQYNKMVEIVRDTSNWSVECKRLGAQLKAAAELNKSACFLKLGDNTNCLTTCNAILKTDHSNVKALFRRAKAQHARGEHVAAQRDLEKVLELDPGNAEARALLPQVARAQRLADTQSKSTFSKMCQGLGKLGSDRPKPAEVKKAPVEEEPKERPTTVTITFRIDLKTEPGESLRVVGSSEVLGAWEAERSLEMRFVPPKREPPTGSGREPPVPHIWEAIVDIEEAEELVEYKYIVRGPSGDRMEGGSNHRVHVANMGGQRQRLTDSWRKSEVS